MMLHCTGCWSFMLEFLGILRVQINRGTAIYMLGLMQVVNILQKCYGLLVMSLFQFVKLKIHTALWTIWVVCVNWGCHS